LVLGDIPDPENTQIYELSLNEDDLGTLVFGDATAGDIPIDGSLIVAEFRVGGGSAGNVATGAIAQDIEATHNDLIVQIGAQGGAGSGGSDREDIEHARLFAPQFARTTDRAVTRSDYLALTNGFTDGANGTIAKAGVLADPTDGISNVVTIYVWAFDSNGQLSTAGGALKDTLWNFLEDRRTISVWLAPIQDGINIPVNIEALIRVNNAFSIDSVKSSVSSVLTELFKENRVQFGNELRVSWVYDTITSVAGIEWTHVKNPDPILVQGATLELESGTTTALQPPRTDQLEIPTPSERAEDFYCNYRVTVGNRTKRVIASTASTIGGGLRSILTTDTDFVPPVGASVGFTFSHPRRVRLQGSTLRKPAGSYDNRVLVIDPASASSIVQERSILVWEGDQSTPVVDGGVAIVDKDWDSTPRAGQNFTITLDYRVPESHALVPGTINITTVR
jgi:hypothetical protein